MLLLLTGSAMTFRQASAEETTAAAFAEFVAQTDRLASLADAYRRGGGNQESLQRTLYTTRIAYKSVAWLIEFYYPTYANDHLNGPPLPRAVKTGARATVTQPEGLQVLDEMVYEREIDRSQLAILARKLHNHARLLQHDVDRRSYPTSEVVEAMRSELIRIPTLYLTGYDTPGSIAGLDESRAALISMQKVLEKHTELNQFPAYGDVLQRMRAAAAALAPDLEFDTFDRLTYQREHLNGLYRALGSLQQTADLPPSRRFPTGLNDKGKDLYGDSFLDPYAYTELTEEEDNPALRSLGKNLFYDKGLSGTGELSCGSCHQPDQFFSGGGDRTNRDVPTLINAVYADRYFYDLRAFSLEQQAEHVIYDRAEYATHYDGIIAKLRADDRYRQQFRSAFGSRSTIDRRTFSAALVSYVLSLRSFNSPFDRYARGETNVLDPNARRGYNLFMGKAGCGSCHFAPTFSGLLPPRYTETESEVLGVLADPFAKVTILDPDRGRAAAGLAHEEISLYEHSFKTPSVRNVAHTAPYFHNGAYPDLASVIDFYDLGGGAGAGHTGPKQTLPANPLNLTSGEKEALIAFMQSLTDRIAEQTIH
ncbi:cytochrome c peroxidase [Lewinella aquimaris]|uniref:Cytochrome c peroxidase n=1 Tax=Neolewinella aquimaris TaxID=1835722 RepID=A0A840EDM8_9BACT|nr:cytochrome c peroxidase [Neolewinella aquimaris]MBB4080068.1 cytochrome c peroxidase [Neolewinella aquimaris]